MGRQAVKINQSITRLLVNIMHIEILKNIALKYHYIKNADCFVLDDRKWTHTHTL